MILIKDRHISYPGSGAEIQIHGKYDTYKGSTRIEAEIFPVCTTREI